MLNFVHKLIRGERINQQIIRETTYADLENRTRNFQPQASGDARQHAVPSVQVQKLELIPSRQTGTLQIKAITSSPRGGKYQPTLMFDKVIYNDSDQADNTTFKGVDNKEYHINPIMLNSTNVKVQCNCLDFYHRFASHNSTDGSLLGSPPPPYQRKIGSNRPPVNPQRTPGLCKHLMRTILALKAVDIVR